MSESEADERNTRRVAAFGDLVVAAMMDAAVERKLCQLLVEITPEATGKLTRVRIIVVPEQMDREFPQGVETQHVVTEGGRGH